MAEGIQIGSTFAGYRVESVLGRGGMGVVFRAEQARLGRMVAIKVIAPELASDDVFRERFSRESRLAAAIEHPNAIPIYEAGVEGKTPYLVMRFVDGVDLSSVIRRDGALDPDRAVTIIEQVAGALDEAHHRGLVHRDVKPANVLVEDRRGREHAYLTDFGLTKQTDSLSGVTATGRWVGTIDYASPEQIRGKRVDARADVYSLGCVLFAALTGRLPFERDADVAKLYAHISDPPPLASSYVAGLPPQLDWVINRALAKDPDERFQSTGDLGRAAHAAVHGERVSKAERTVATGAAAPDESVNPAAVAAPTPPSEAIPPTDVAASPQPTEPASPPSEPAPTPPEPASQPPEPVAPTVDTPVPAPSDPVQPTVASDVADGPAVSEGDGATVAMGDASVVPVGTDGGDDGDGSAGGDADGGGKGGDPTPSRLAAAPGEAPTKVRTSPPKEKRSKIGILLLIAVAAVAAVIAFGGGGGGGGDTSTTADKKQAPAKNTNYVELKQSSFTVDVPGSVELPKKGEDALEDLKTAFRTELSGTGDLDIQIVENKEQSTPEEVIDGAIAEKKAEPDQGAYRMIGREQLTINDEPATKYSYVDGESADSAISVTTYAFNREGRTWRTRAALPGDTPNLQTLTDEYALHMAETLVPGDFPG